MKILHVSPSYYSTRSVIGGGERYVEYLYRAIRDQAREAGVALDSQVVLSMDSETGLYTSQDGVKWKIIPGQPWRFDHIRVVQLREELSGADVVIAHQGLTPFGLYVAAQAKMLGKLVVGIDHGGPEHPLIHHSPQMTSIFDFFLAYSEFASYTYKSFARPTKLLRGPVDDEYYDIDDSVRRIDDLVVSVGRLLPHKGVETLIDALPRSLRLVIAGSAYDKAYFEYLTGLMRKANKSIEVKQNLNNAEIRALIRSASLLVHPSTHYTYMNDYIDKPELLGLAPLEALCCGTPVLVSTAGSLDELCRVHGCQSFADGDDLAEQLALHANLATRKQFAPADVRKSAVAHFGLAQFGKAFLREIAQVETAAAPARQKDKAFA